MLQEDTDASVAKRVFSIFIEQAQNVVRYSVTRIAKDPTLPISAGLIIAGMDKGRFFVVCGNELPRKDVPLLSARLGGLATMSPEELQAHYRTKLREPRMKAVSAAALA